MTVGTFSPEMGPGKVGDGLLEVQGRAGMRCEWH